MSASASLSMCKEQLRIEQLRIEQLRSNELIRLGIKRNEELAQDNEQLRIENDQLRATIIRQRTAIRVMRQTINGSKG